jgi:hypothetical protein
MVNIFYELIIIITQDLGYNQQLVNETLNMIQMSQLTIDTIVYEVNNTDIGNIFLTDNQFIDNPSILNMQRQLHGVRDFVPPITQFAEKNLPRSTDEAIGMMVRISGRNSVNVLFWLFTNPYGLILVLIGLFKGPALIRYINNLIISSILRRLPRNAHIGNQQVQPQLIADAAEVEIRGGGSIILTNKMCIVLNKLNPKDIQKIALKYLKQDYPSHPITLLLSKIYKKNIYKLAWDRLSNRVKRTIRNTLRKLKQSKGGKRNCCSKKRRSYKKYHK